MEQGLPNLFFEDKRLENWSIFKVFPPNIKAELHMVMVFGTASTRSAIIVTKNKKVYGLGDNTFAQLGFRPMRGENNLVTEPKEIEELRGMPIKTIRTMEHSVSAVTEIGEHLSDLKIKIGRKCLYVHKELLKVRCQYFERFSDDDWAQSSALLPYSCNYSYNVYKAFFKYLYTGIIELPLEKIYDLAELAKEYNVADLMSDIVQKIKYEINVSNVFSIFQTKDSHLRGKYGRHST